MTCYLDLCPHNCRCDYGDDHVPLHGGVGSDWTVASRKIHTYVPNAYDHPQVSPSADRPRSTLVDVTTFPRNSGLLKPGEMCLVLGCPASGCTTFLKAIANERESYAGVAGDVRYAGINNVEMNKHYRGEVVYNREGQRFSFSGFRTTG